MKLEDYNQAKDIRDRMDEFDKMSAALQTAANDVIKLHNKSDAEELAALIMKLVETKEGERVLESIVGTFAMRFHEAKRELQKMFDEL
jgi:hypothetical protein